MIELLKQYLDAQRQEMMDVINQLKQIIEELNNKIEAHKTTTDQRITELTQKHEVEKAQMEASIMLQLTALRDVTGKL